MNRPKKRKKKEIVEDARPRQEIEGVEEEVEVDEEELSLGDEVIGTFAASFARNKVTRKEYK